MPPPPSGPPRLSRFDVFTKIEREFTKGTQLGAVVSLVAMAIMAWLFVSEVRDYLSPHIGVSLVMDEGTSRAARLEAKMHPAERDASTGFVRGRAGETMRINFNVTMERLACEHLALELHNVLGTHQTDITKNIAKFRIKTKGDVQRTLEKAASVEPRRELAHEEEGAVAAPPDADVKPEELTPETFEKFIAQHSVVLVAYVAPWCIWCQRLAPVWEAVAHDFAKDFGTSRVGIAKVDCTLDDRVALCHRAAVQAFPWILSYRSGESHSYELYHGDRTVQAFRDFVTEQLKLAHVPTDLEPHEGRRALKQAEDADFHDGDGEHQPAVEGCRVEGHVVVPKVPGTLVFAPHMADASIDTTRVNVSHVVHHLSFGDPFSHEELRILPREVSDAMHLLQDEEFVSTRNNATHEHFVKVVATTYTYLSVGTIDTFKYTHYFATFHSEETHLPTARVQFEIAPVRVVVTETHKPFFRFATNVFALCGGAYTFFSLVDSALHSAHDRLKRRLGKAA